jgi:hypothetical protein
MSFPEGKIVTITPVEDRTRSLNLRRVTPYPIRPQGRCLTKLIKLSKTDLRSVRTSFALIWRFAPNSQYQV